MNRETWYVLEDGSVADPNDIVTKPNGRLEHSDGRPVKYRDDGCTPWAKGVDADTEREKAAAMKKASETPKEPVKPVEPPEPPKAAEDGQKPAPVQMDMRPQEPAPAPSTKGGKKGTYETR